MELTEAIERRRSIRSYTAKPVPPAIVNEALRLANLAPSAGNYQSRDFIVVTDPKSKHALAVAAFEETFVEEAPVVLVACANLRRVSQYGERGRTLYCLLDTASALEHAVLYFASQELGTCWVGAFDEKAVSEILGLPADVRPVVILPVGYPNEVPEPRFLLPPSKWIHSEHW